MSANRLLIGIGSMLVPAFLLAASPMGTGLDGSPFAQFTDADREVFRDSAQQAANGPLGEVKEWSNAKSGAHGTVKAVRNYQRDDATCRELRGQNTARGRSEPFRIAICKRADGKWRLAPYEPPAKTAPPAAKTVPPSAPEAQKP